MKKNKIKTFIISFIILLLTVFTHTQSVTIDLESQNQTIRGFGGMNFPRWIDDMTEAQIDKAFGVEDGQLGLNILRISISPDSEQWALEVPAARRAVSLGAIILATPWSPPASMKTNNSTIKGELSTGSYSDYAEYLSDFADYMSSNDVPVYAISIQNEPDYLPDYESCGWSPEQIRNFLAYNASVIPAKILMPETVHFKQNYLDTVLNNSAAAQEADIVGYHLYGGNPTNYPLAGQLGKEVWMTEHYTSSNVDANNWPDALGVGEEVHNCMINNINAYIWWYIRRFYGFLDDNGNMTKRGYVMSHFSRFVRPGYKRVNATSSPLSNVYVTAYTNDSKVVIIAINRNSSTANLSFYLSGSQVNSFTKYETSSTGNVSDLGNIIAGASFSDTLAGNSISTYVGAIGETGDNIIPTANAGADQIITDTDKNGSESVTLDGTGSNDPDGTISSYTWTDQEGNQLATGVNPLVSLSTGTHIITLTVIDNEGAIDSDEVTITVLNGSGYDCETEIEISIPFSLDGEGDSCYVTVDSANSINSWNMDYLEINGQDFTNTWAWATDFPASEDGKIHIHYKASVAWAHFEIK